MKRTAVAMAMAMVLMTAVAAVAIEKDPGQNQSAEQAKSEGEQAKPAAETEVPILTELEKVTMQAKIQRLQMAQERASPAGIAKAVEQLITQVLQDMQAANVDAAQFVTSIQAKHPGCELDIETGTLRQIPGESKICGAKQ